MKRMQEDDHLKLCMWHIISPMIGGVSAIVFGPLYFYLVRDVGLFQNSWVVQNLSSVVPFMIVVVVDLVLSLWKRLYLFPPKAPEGTPFLKTARYAWANHCLFFVVLTVMIIVLTVR